VLSSSSTICLHVVRSLPFYLSLQCPIEDYFCRYLPSHSHDMSELFPSLPVALSEHVRAISCHTVRTCPRHLLLSHCQNMSEPSPPVTLSELVRVNSISSLDTLRTRSSQFHPLLSHFQDMFESTPPPPVMTCSSQFHPLLSHCPVMFQSIPSLP
jgi:hypothetical protein